MESNHSGKICGYVRTDIGLARENNEDNFLIAGCINAEMIPKKEAIYVSEITGEWTCFGVFDGIGGEEHGELAAKLAAEAILGGMNLLSHDCEYDDVDRIMKQSFLDGNNRVVDERKCCSVCGTTGTVFVTDGIMGKVYHVGDCRAYLLREKKLYQMTKDQTLAQLKLAAGFYQSIHEATPKELHQLTEYIGRDDSKQYFTPMETKWFDFKKDDVILLCSDGIYDVCHATVIRDVIEQEVFPKQIGDRLVEFALDGAGEDNITCLVIKKTK